MAERGRGEHPQQFELPPEETNEQSLRPEVIEPSDALPHTAQLPDSRQPISQESDSTSNVDEPVLNKRDGVTKLWHIPTGSEIDPVKLQEIMDNTMSFGDTEQIDV